MLFLNIASAFFRFEEADAFLLPCPFKYITGYDCPGCGFQRAMLALFNGDLFNSFKLYPPAIPIILTIIISLIARRSMPPTKSERVVTSLYLITGSIIMLNYGFKLLHMH